MKKEYWRKKTGKDLENDGKIVSKCDVVGEKYSFSVTVLAF